MVTKRVDLFMERPPSISLKEGKPKKKELPDILRRLVDLQDADQALKSIEDGAVYKGENQLLASHANHGDTIWGNHANHNEYHEHYNWKD